MRTERNEKMGRLEGVPKQVSTESKEFKTRKAPCCELIVL